MAKSDFSKKNESQALKIYQRYWESFFKGDLKTFGSILDEDCKMNGASISKILIVIRQTSSLSKPPSRPGRGLG